MKHIVLCDDQYKNLVDILKKGLLSVYSNNENIQIHAIPLKDYYEITSLREYDEMVDAFINSVPENERDNYCILLDWVYIYSSNGVNKSEWYGDHLYRKFKNSGFNNILIFSNYTDDKDFKNIILDGALCFGKPDERILSIYEEEKWLEAPHVKNYFNYLKLLIDTLFFDIDVNKYGMLFGSSRIMENVKELINKASSSMVNVLVLGASGTGKELTAQAIHNLSIRNDKRFLAINCSGIPSELLETELFGYAPGTFTDQLKEGKVGLLREADGGTILLDEIGDMPLIMQAKLLRFLQDFKVSPVGSSDEISVDVRIICSTNKDLQSMVKEYEESLGKKGFRSDLYWRIKVFQISLPSLTERFQHDPELPYILFFYFLRRAFMKNRIPRIADLSLSKAAYKLVLNYHWPGNFREFENVVLSATAMLNSDENVITDAHLRMFLTESESLSENNIVQHYISILNKNGTLDDIPRKYHKEVLEQYISQEIEKYKRIKTEDLIDVVLGEKKETDKERLKKQTARVTQCLNRHGINLRSLLNNHQ